MRGNVIETLMGAVVLVAAALFLVFAYKTSQLRTVSGYEVSADFARIDGIHQGSDVRISGVKIGTVLAEDLDPKTFLATIRMSVDPAIQLPDDTVAAVTSSGLLGDKYMSLTPGGSDKNIPAGGKIRYTQSSVSLESMIGQMIFSPSGSKKEGGDAQPAPGGGAAAPAPGAAAPPTPAAGSK